MNKCCKENLKLAWCLTWFFVLMFACAYITLATDGQMLGGDTWHKVTLESEVGNAHVAPWMWKYILPERALIIVGIILAYSIGGSLLFVIPFALYVNGKKRRDVDTAFYPGASRDLEYEMSNDEVLDKAIRKNGITGLDKAE